MTFSGCKKENEPLALARATLTNVMRPKVSFEVGAALLAGPATPTLDNVTVIDMSREPT